MTGTYTTFHAQGPSGTLVGLDTDSAADSVPALLVHGINMSSDTWADVVPLLAVDRRVIAFDLRGHGRSSHAGPFTPEGYASDVLAVMDHLQIDKAHIAGISFGGAVACQLGSEAPERVQSIAAFGSALTIEGVDVDAAVGALRAIGLEAFFREFLPQASFAPGTDAGLIERAVMTATHERDVETVIAVAEAAFGADMTTVARRVRVPALVVTGEVDLTCPVTAGAAMAEVLNSEHEIVPGKGHVLSMEAPETTAQLIRRHIEAYE